MRRIGLMSSTGLAALVCAVAPGVAAASQHGERHHHGHHHKARHANARADAGTVTSFAGGVLTITLSDGKSAVVGQVNAGTRLRCVSATVAASRVARVADHGRGRGDGNGRGDGSGDRSGDNNDGRQGEPGEDHDTPPATGTPPSSTSTPPASGKAGREEPGDDNQHDTVGAMACDSTSLVAGTVVHEAELKLGENGAVFERIVLVKA